MSYSTNEFKMVLTRLDALDKESVKLAKGRLNAGKIIAEVFERLDKLEKRNEELEQKVSELEDEKNLGDNIYFKFYDDLLMIDDWDHGVQWADGHTEYYN